MHVLGQVCYTSAPQPSLPIFPTKGRARFEHVVVGGDGLVTATASDPNAFPALALVLAIAFAVIRVRMGTRRQARTRLVRGSSTGRTLLIPSAQAPEAPRTVETVLVKAAFAVALLAGALLVFLPRAQAMATSYSSTVIG